MTDIFEIFKCFQQISVYEKLGTPAGNSVKPVEKYRIASIFGASLRRMTNKAGCP